MRFLAGVLLLTACYVPLDGAPYLVTDNSRRWWAEIEDCSGLYAPIEGVEIRVVEDLIARENRIGAFIPPNIINIQAGYEDGPYVLQHEAFHYLLLKVESRRDSAHNDPRWVRCNINIR
jgi:hypothetical protein